MIEIKGWIGWKLERQVENAGYDSINPYDFDKGILRNLLEDIVKNIKKHQVKDKGDG